VYAVEVSDQIMIAHSFRGAVFGPAQELHGATFVVRAAFFSERLKYRNLDDLPQFKGVNTTTEFLTRYVYDLLADAARSGGLGRSGNELSSIRVTVAESPSARAWYEAPLR
jgi:hypothetical protein